MTWTQPKSFEEAKGMASIIARSSFSKLDPETIFCMILAGADLGLSPMNAVRAFHAIPGRTPTLSADAVRGLAKRHPDCITFRLVSDSNTAVTYEAQRKGDPEPTTMTFTMAQAEKARLTKNPLYRTHPNAMLRARCSMMLARQMFPDAMFGLIDEGPDVEYVAMEPAKTQPPAPKALPLSKPNPLTEAEGIALAKQSKTPSEAAHKCWTWLVDHGFYSKGDTTHYKAAIDSMMEDVGAEPSHEDVGRLWAKLTQPAEPKPEPDTEGEG